MPPIQSVVPRHVQVQMDALRKQYHGLEGLISRLNNLTGSPLAVQQELARSAREESKSIESKIEDLRLLADEQDRESDRALVVAMLEKIETQFKQQQQALRQAILSSKQTIDREAKSERELLLKGSMSAIELSEIRRRGAARGSESEYMLNTNESSKTLKATVGEYHAYDEVLKRGKGLITKLNQADWTDRLLIGFGLLVFSLVVMYILKKRIADRGISLVGYLFMPIRWFFSLLMPSLRTTPLSPETASEMAGVIVEKAAAGTPLVKAAAEQLQMAKGAGAAAAAAPTSAAQGFVGILDKIIGD
ncbi:Vesicle transport protein S20 [Linnemannia gamsii]|uniref:Vesicle transport protein S20 n=1 Tax=Linnemannia gamsii TaxID=64522 RepID=A0A9P6QZI7_9FUNG|nr:Vesicle transport protein S20 [Linnemannia gamsii]